MKTFEEEFRLPTEVDLDALFRQEPTKWRMSHATDEEIIKEMRVFGGFKSYKIERIGRNVVIADNAIVVALKQEGNHHFTLYCINGESLPLPDYEWEHISWKMWATDEIMDDIRRAERIMLTRLDKKQRRK